LAYNTRRYSSTGRPFTTGRPAHVAERSAMRLPMNARPAMFHHPGQQHPARAHHHCPVLLAGIAQGWQLIAGLGSINKKH